MREQLVFVAAESLLTILALAAIFVVIQQMYWTWRDNKPRLPQIKMVRGLLGLALAVTLALLSGSSWLMLDSWHHRWLSFGTTLVFCGFFCGLLIYWLEADRRRIAPPPPGSVAYID